jgi:hypothetical protein
MGKLFEKYSKFETMGLGKNGDGSKFLMSYKGLLQLGRDTKITPKYISIENLSLVFKYIMKEKEQICRNGGPDGNPAAIAKDKVVDMIKNNEFAMMTFEEFQELLVRVSTLEKYKLGIKDPNPKVADNRSPSPQKKAPVGAGASP